MSIKIGDRVRFLNETGEGRVTSVRGKMATVLLSNGMEIPFPLEQLVPARDMVKTESRQASSFHGLSGQNLQFTESLYLCFVAAENNFFDTFLVNNTSYTALFSFSSKQGPEFLLIRSGKTEPGETLLLKRFNLGEIDASPDFKTEALYFRNGKYQLKPPLCKIVVADTKKLLKPSLFIPNPFFSQPAFCLALDEELKEEEPLNIDISQLEKAIRDKTGKVTLPRKKISHQEPEIDLHIEELTDDISGMSNSQMLDIQLRHFRQKLEEAIAGGIRKITVIHGVGAGRLKLEVRSILKKEYEELEFFDAPYHKYGFGATEIRIRL